MRPEQQQLTDQIKARKTTKQFTVVRINLDAIKQSKQLDFTLQGQASSATRQSMTRRSEDDFSWRGQLADQPGDAMLAVYGEAVEGTIRRGNQLFRIESLGNGMHALIEVDESQFPPDEPPSFKQKELLARPVNLQQGKADMAAGDATMDNTATLDSANLDSSTLSSIGPVTKVLVAYTGSVETAKGGAANTLAMIQLAVDETNASYQNSKVNTRLQLVYRGKVAYSESGKSYDTIVNDLAGTTDGSMDTLHTLRNTYAADVVVLIVNQTDYCGMADAIWATPTSAFAAVHYSCATGYYSFGHEIGHLQGARHNIAADPTTTPFSYGHGFQGPSWRTIMAYDCSPSCPRLPYWSNPSIKYGGVAMGNADQANDARALSTTGPQVSTFRNPSGAIWRYTGTPCSGDSCPGWQRLDNNTRTVSVAAGSSSILYQLHNDGRIWRYTGVPCSGVSCPGWQLIDNNTKTIAITADGSNLYQLHTDGRIWRYTGTPCSGSSCPGWQMLDNNARTQSITAANGALYQLHNNGLIWRYTGTPCSGNSCPGWQLLDNNAKTKSIVAASGGLFQLHNDGWIWRYTGTPCSGGSCPGWQRLDNNLKTTAITAAGTALYQLHNDGWIWRYTGTPCTGNSCPGWQRLDNNPKTTAIVAATGGLYQLHNDGWIWRYTGTPCSGNYCPGWQRLDNNTQTRAIDAASTGLFQVHGK
ncbi:M12 family metallo-peptidase [Chitinimonas sp. PSY-7]|uniref:M12 family metallo-peptidase n=1 Tax=Chitinimonas sp. PSY-7 TaxID=3459088 RepID=UPI0040403CB3